MGDRLVGSVSHYFGGAGVAGISVEGALAVGDTIHVVGHTTDLTQEVESMQIEHEPVDTAGPGDQVGIAITDRVRIHDRVFVADGD